MYLKILCHREFRINERLKRLILYLRIRRGAKLNWKRYFRKLYKILPTYACPDDKIIERNHRAIWSYFDKNINLSTLRVSKNISGISDPRIIPEEIFATDIEPTLNNTREAGWLNMKSVYNHWFPKGIFPKDFFHNIDGEWLDGELNPILFSEIEAFSRRMKYPVVVKPNRDSYGGKGIFLPMNSDALISYIKDRKNIIVQEKINQHSFFSQYHKNSLNTLRVYVYRSVVDNKLHIINAVLRMGLGESFCDNITSGGIKVLVRQDGFLNGYAIDIFGKKYYTHPDSGLAFNGRIPEWDRLKAFTIEIASKVLYVRIMGLDICLDDQANWRMIEINNFSTTISMSQYYGIPFFGEFFEEVYEYCKLKHWALS